jgi:hypothetical protein
MNGGSLTYTMGSEPNMEWGIGVPPPSNPDK